MSHPALTQLRALRYFEEIPALDPEQLDWLLLEDSMTKRFEQQGKRVTVTLIREGFVGQNEGGGRADATAKRIPLLAA
ncbi:chorismate pyruvate lyase [Citrobacter amalonaticus]|nr:chorismate pyruvate lyase [Citrobacter amalonaticus]